MIARIRSLTVILILMSSAALAGQPQNFVGTWLTTVTPPAEAGAPPFTLLLTLHADGNLLASGTAGEFPALGNPCHGTWVAKGNEIQASYVCLDFDDGSGQTSVAHANTPREAAYIGAVEAFYIGKEMRVCARGIFAAGMEVVVGVRVGSILVGRDF